MATKNVKTNRTDQPIRVAEKQKPHYPKPPTAFDFFEYYPESAHFLARWANAVAILNTVAEEFMDLESLMAIPLGGPGASHVLRFDKDRVKEISLAVHEASEAASVPPCRGSLDPVLAGRGGKDGAE